MVCRKWIWEKSRLAFSSMIIMSATPKVPGNERIGIDAHISWYFWKLIHVTYKAVSAVGRGQLTVFCKFIVRAASIDLGESLRRSSKSWHKPAGFSLGFA